MSELTTGNNEQSRDARAPAARRHPPLHRVEYALARSLESVVSTLPERAADAFGRNAGNILYRLGVRRNVVEENLRIAFPRESDEWLERTARASYEHLGREVAAMLRLSKLDGAAVVERTRVVGWDRIEHALSLGRGALLVTGHYGNWEIAAASVAARGVPIAAIVRRQANRLVDERVQQLRRKLGVETIYQGEAPALVPRILRANGVVGIVGDQDARRSGIFVPFFGRPASTHRGPALFALRFGAAIVSAISRRLPGRDVRYDVTAEFVDQVSSGNLDHDVQALTTELARRLEQEIRVAPEQYFWFHKRWKTRPPGDS
jgi:KDO2-lipid IV(A) lauroyltransferase